MIDQIRQEPGKKYALTFTILVHVGLIAALFLGVQWKSSPPEVMDVELWAARPTPAARVVPPPSEPEVKPPPKPQPKVETKPEPVPPKKPDIAIKEEKKKPPEPKKPEPKPEPPKPEAKKPEPKPEVKPPPKVPDFSKELLRETSELKPRPNTQQLNNAAAAEAEQRAAANKRGLADYTNKIRMRIKSNMTVLPPSIQGNPEAVFEVTQLPTAEILAVKLKRSSGNPALDSIIENAIRRSSPLPKPDNPALFERIIEIKYKPFEE